MREKLSKSKTGELTIKVNVDTSELEAVLKGLDTAASELSGLCYDLLERIRKSKE